MRKTKRIRPGRASPACIACRLIYVPDVSNCPRSSGVSGMTDRYSFEFSAGDNPFRSSNSADRRISSDPESSDWSSTWISAPSPAWAVPSGVPSRVSVALARASAVPFAPTWFAAAPACAELSVPILWAFSMFAGRRFSRGFHRHRSCRSCCCYLIDICFWFCLVPRFYQDLPSTPATSLQKRNGKLNIHVVSRLRSKFLLGRLRRRENCLIFYAILCIFTSILKYMKLANLLLLILLAYFCNSARSEAGNIHY